MLSRIGMRPLLSLRKRATPLGRTLPSTCLPTFAQLSTAAVRSEEEEQFQAIRDFWKSWKFKPTPPPPKSDGDGASSQCFEIGVRKRLFLTTAEQKESLRRLLDMGVKTSQADVVPSIVVKNLCIAYLSMEKEAKTAFLSVIASELSQDRDEIQASLESAQQALRENRSPEALRRCIAGIQHSISPRYEHLINKVISFEWGMKFLIDMRADVLSMIDDTKKQADTPSDPFLSVSLRQLDDSLKGKLAEFFRVGFLHLSKIGWDSPALLMEKLMKYEAVHPIHNFAAMKQRLGYGRRCYAFFHPSMKDEPLVFVQVALCPTIPGSIQSILQQSTHDPDVQLPLCPENPSKLDGIVQRLLDNSSASTPSDGGYSTPVPKGFPSLSCEEEDAKVATFYSISSTQKGLKGVEMGNLLIKRVVKELQNELPHVNTFCTLSPIPGFGKWLRRMATLSHPGDRHPFLDSITALPAFQHARDIMSSKGIEPSNLWDVVLYAEKLGSSGSQESRKVGELVETLCAHYLINEKRRGKALDPVANFHVRNGAEVHKLHFLGDVSPAGWKQSSSMMVNYLYRMDSIEENHLQYVMDGRIATGGSVAHLAAQISC
uniref:Malonyl-CoA decarboxylase n=1 Tax=Palpitomonas bilix TaxID=652834 RepID=A0A7S3GK67_9EUKA|mmetsp:Transcript_6854/g.17241  ORF Transcript_6854/g.17241 Transcript_6854/m.17241 type:complete len:602 (+) Transcript_6854:270-2075(+)